MGKCSLCGSQGVSVSSCPLNVNALSTKPLKHPLAARLAAPMPVAAAPEAPVVAVAAYKDAKAPKLPRGQVGKNTQKWEQRKPTTKAQREQLAERCGPSCYLIPELQKYPVCAKGSCDYDCDGIRAARNITYLIVNKKNTSEEARSRALRARDHAQRLGVEHCGWA